MRKKTIEDRGLGERCKNPVIQLETTSILYCTQCWTFNLTAQSQTVRTTTRRRHVWQSSRKGSKSIRGGVIRLAVFHANNAAAERLSIKFWSICTPGLKKKFLCSRALKGFLYWHYCNDPVVSSHPIAILLDRSFPRREGFQNRRSRECGAAGAYSRALLRQPGLNFARSRALDTVGSSSVACHCEDQYWR